MYDKHFSVHDHPHLHGNADRSATLSWLYANASPSTPASTSPPSPSATQLHRRPPPRHRQPPPLPPRPWHPQDHRLHLLLLRHCHLLPLPPSSTQFLHDTNSSFFINLYPYNLYRLRPEIPLGIALFQDYPFNFRDAFTTCVRYRNLFDVMVDAVVSALAVAGYETVPVVVTETGWPRASSAANEFEANAEYAEIYLWRLVKHLKSRMGTPLLREGRRE